MTVTFGTNSNNDIFINSSGLLDIQTGLTATLQACAQISQAQLGEMVFEAESGIPNFQTLWVGVPNLVQWEAALRNAILNVEGVVNILNLSTNFVNNVLSYTAVILTVYGKGAISSNNTQLNSNNIIIGEDGLPIFSEGGQPLQSE